MREIELIGELSDGYEEQIRIGDEYINDVTENFIGKYVMVSYMISDEKLTKEEFIKRNIEYVFGKLDAHHYPSYGSEYTGFMWTDDRFKVDGHDILQNLRSHISYTEQHYCYFRIILHDRDFIIDKLLK